MSPAKRPSSVSTLLRRVAGKEHRQWFCAGCSKTTAAGCSLDSPVAAQFMFTSAAGVGL